MTGEAFVQIGVTALRDPATGNFLPAESLHKKVHVKDVDKRTGLVQCELNLSHDIGDILAEKFCEDVRGCRREVVKICPIYIAFPVIPASVDVVEGWLSCSVHNEAAATFVDEFSFWEMPKWRDSVLISF